MTSDPTDRNAPATPQRDAKPTSSPRPKGGKRRRSPGIPGGTPGMRIDTTGPRHQARVLAMQSLYEHDLTGHDLEDILTRLRDEEDEAVPPPLAERVMQLVRGVTEHREELDPHIERAAPQFPIPQLAAVDRTVLRIAIFELKFAPDVPYKAVINEAVEIAKRFGGPNSGRFVNGVLGTIVDQLPASRKEKPQG
jgi:transcription antitermination protein NusB